MKLLRVINPSTLKDVGKNIKLKGSLTRDFELQAFFMKEFPPAP
jgi:hypothetical protein